MHKLILKGNKAFNWSNNGNHHLIGMFFKDNVLLQEEKAIDYLIKNETQKLENGIYSLISITESEITIKCDSINYFPIFYTFLNSKWVLSDSWEEIIRVKENFAPNTMVETEFINAGFVLGNNTLDKDIHKTRSGKITILKSNGNVDFIPQWDYIQRETYSENIEKLKTKSFDIFESTAKRMISFLNGRTAVVPLSGGFDSRLIASLLKKHNYKDVICFTYGKPNQEVDISRKVAKTLGYKWYFIDYTKLKIADFNKDPDFLKYIDFAGNGYSMPYLQEYFAVNELKTKGLIPENSVFLPGHSGDFIGGSYVLKSAKTNTKNIPAYIAKKYFFFFENKDNKSLEKSISSNIDIKASTHQNGDYNSFIEDWDIKEKLSKFIFHSSVVFNYFDYQHYFPLWDLELLLFYRNVPYPLRAEKNLYDHTLIEFYFKPLDVYYDDDELSKTKTYIIYQRLKDSLRHFFPWSYVKKRMTQNDWINYSQFCSILENELSQNGFNKLKRYKLFNAVICKWYLYKK